MKVRTSNFSLFFRLFNYLLKSTNQILPVMVLCFVSSSQILSWSKIIKSKRRDLASLNYQKQQGVGSGLEISIQVVVVELMALPVFLVLD